MDNIEHQIKLVTKSSEYRTVKERVLRTVLPLICSCTRYAHLESEKLLFLKDSTYLLQRYTALFADSL